MKCKVFKGGWGVLQGAETYSTFKVPQGRICSKIVKSDILLGQETCNLKWWFILSF